MAQVNGFVSSGGTIQRYRKWTWGLGGLLIGANGNTDPLITFGYPFGNATVRLVGGTAPTSVQVQGSNDGGVTWASLGPSVSFANNNPVYFAFGPGTTTTITEGGVLSAVATGANTALTATLTADNLYPCLCTGFEISGSGATAASVITATLTGTLGGTQSWTIAVPAGVTAPLFSQGAPFTLEYPIPLAAATKSTNIVLTLPALGAGNTNAAINLHGIQFNNSQYINVAPAEQIRFAISGGDGTTSLQIDVTMTASMG